MRIKLPPAPNLYNPREGGFFNNSNNAANRFNARVTLKVGIYIGRFAPLGYLKMGGGGISRGLF